MRRIMALLAAWLLGWIEPDDDYLARHPKRKPSRPRVWPPADSPWWR